MYDIAILGAGPGGYAAALYAHNFGLSVAMVEKDVVGGTCLNRGCIPAKQWLYVADVFQTVKGAAEFGVKSSDPELEWSAALARKNQTVERIVRGLSGLLKERNVEVIEGYGRLEGAGRLAVEGPSGIQTVEARHLIIATGSTARTIPGYEFDGERIVNSDHALDWASQPERVAIIGAGAVGCEFASLLADLGTEVHLFELMDQIVPGSDPEAVKVLDRELARKGVKITTGASVGPPQITETGVTVTAGDASAEVDVVLIAVGRAPLTEGIGLETTKVGLDAGFVNADLASMQTAEPGVYAVGDIVAGTPQLAHAGFAEGIAAVTHIATGEAAPVQYRAVPLVVYTHPELAEVGLTESEARAQGYEVETATHAFNGLGRAIIIGQNRGLVKVVSEKGGPILGASVVGPQAGELIHELMYAVGWEALPAEAGALIHAHPTLAEAVGETLLTAGGRSLH